MVELFNFTGLLTLDSGDFIPQSLVIDLASLRCYDVYDVKLNIINLSTFYHKLQIFW